MSVRYESDPSRVPVEALGPAEDGARFFEGWPNPPSPETHLAILRGSRHAVVAIDEASGLAVGFANAIGDGVLAAFIPLLEVRGPQRGRGIGRALIVRLLDEIGPVYSVDVACDENVVAFYESLGFQRGVAMMRRDWSRQAGRAPRDGA